MKPCILATRQSPLALAQAHLVAGCFLERLALECVLQKFVTIGDRQAEWSLEKKGGKGLFTGELEQSLLAGNADIAVHSTKDLPGDMPAGLAIAGYLPRADPRDVLVLREGVAYPRTIATGSPRRRLQLQELFPAATFTELRGNVDTRLRKVAAGVADATVLAAAGLARLGIATWPGLVFRPLAMNEMTPAVGQGAIAVQCRAADVGKFTPALDQATARQINLERALQAALGAGCHTAFGALVEAETLHLYHELTGSHRIEITAAGLTNPRETARTVLGRLQLIPGPVR
ncbi:hydroxymethylbilane synthase [Opitutus sp. GAS368]|uniref:hydroxymethylbilane synthase n=1 Tax=Opitutus sp. GAS368 TaxID=1882749 RepID=UPI00087DC254|nr:hydroxymethylbilane synthase [Opitutus sp. GAS368]SDS43490.1 hydroxymethylbilane synthase [Opitutus sp. GAS368]